MTVIAAMEGSNGELIKKLFEIHILVVTANNNRDAPVA